MGDLLLLSVQALSWLIAWGSLIVIGLLTTCRACDRLLFTTKAPRLEPPRDPVPDALPMLDVMDVRSLRQMGVTSSTVSAIKRDNQVVQQRRRKDRRSRLARIELVE
jgi:hypothetical protein